VTAAGAGLILAKGNDAVAVTTAGVAVAFPAVVTAGTGTVAVAVAVPGVTVSPVDTVTAGCAELAVRVAALMLALPDAAAAGTETATGSADLVITALPLAVADGNAAPAVTAAGLAVCPADTETAS
jgi:hypothetical protein